LEKHISDHETKKKQISLIVPVHNEELRIEKGISRICDYFETNGYDYEILITEDGSTDKTVEIAQDLQNKNNKIIVHSSRKKIGKGRAISNSIVLAKKEFIAYIDVDLAADPSELERLFDKINNYDIAIGSRLLRGDLPPIERPFYRTFFSFFYSRFFRILFRNPIIDPQCGFKLFRKETVSELFKNITTSGFAFDSEVIVKAYSLNYKIVEVPIIWSHEKASKLRVSQQMKEMGKDLLKIWYESHILWINNQNVYPQKKGSLIGRLLFWILGSMYQK